MTLVIQTHHDHDVFEITFNDSKRRNALGLEMFEGLELALQQIQGGTRCVLLRGDGAVFCAGFDMKACANDITILESYINKLSTIIRLLRRIPCPVVVAAHGGAIAGGCALLTGCDFIIGERNGKYGYPVHQLGISPSVTIPTLFQRIGEGKTRSLLMGGEVIDGNQAFQIGLLTSLCETSKEVETVARVLASDLAAKPPVAIQATKQWLNELDGSLQDEPFDSVAHASFSIQEAKDRLQKYWGK